MPLRPGRPSCGGTSGDRSATPSWRPPSWSLSKTFRHGAPHPSARPRCWREHRRTRTCGWHMCQWEGTPRLSAPDDLEGRERLARCERILDALDEGVWEIRYDGGPSFFSQRAFTMLGYDPPPSAEARDFLWSITHPDDESTARQLLGELKRGERDSYSLDIRMRGAEGEWHYVALRVRCAERADDGQVLAAVGTLSDVSDERRAALAARDAHRSLQQVLESISDGMFVINDDFEFTYFNRAAEDLLGRPRDEVVGRHFAEAFPEAAGSVFEEEYRAALRTREFRSFEVYFGLAPYENWYDVRVHPHDEGIAVFFQVTTERKLAERALRESEERYRALVQSALDGIVVAGPDQRVREANPALCDLLGRPRDELIGTDVWDLTVGESEGDLGSLLERDPEAAGGIGETALKASDGEEVPVEVRLGRFRQGDEDLYLGIVRDVTHRIAIERERREFEANLQQAQKLESLGLLAGGIAHDFNNLLMGVLGNADLALNTMLETAPARPFVRNIETAARRAADLCNQMLAYSGKGRFIVEDLDLSELVEEMVHMLEVSVSKAAALRLSLASDLPAISADASQIRQVVMNLIVNASDALGDQVGVINLSTEANECDAEYLAATYLDDSLKPGSYVVLEVSDTGCGMDAETQERIFDPFFTTKFAGRGLGMAAVLGIVRGHGGAIKLYSEVGTGTTIKVLLPASTTSDTRKGSAEGRPGRDMAGAGDMTVLVVDDEDTVREVATAMLQTIGFQALAAPSGEAAMEVYLEDPGRIDCVLMDLTMPGMDGQELFRLLRRHDPALPVVLSSGYSRQEVAQRFAGMRLTGFVQKPYRLRTLREALFPLLASPESPD
ncbi:MAG: PAS domain S-box protein [Armatimonadia bacterium]|nr:PAS domain S-box protein [Armatimonadia bacterium]